MSLAVTLCFMFPTIGVSVVCRNTVNSLASNRAVSALRGASLTLCPDYYNDSSSIAFVLSRFSLGRFAAPCCFTCLARYTTVQVEADPCLFLSGDGLSTPSWAAGRRKTLRFGNSKSRIFIFALCSCDFELPTEQSSIWAIS